jgi:hypothetical protein
MTGREFGEQMTIGLTVATQRCHQSLFRFRSQCGMIVDAGTLIPVYQRIL